MLKISGEFLRKSKWFPSKLLAYLQGTSKFCPPMNCPESFLEFCKYGPYMNLSPFTFVLPVHSPIADQYQRPLFESMVSAGFPSPAEDYYDGYLNLHQYLIPDPNNVFFVRANGDSMTGAGIFDQDLLIVDRSKKKPNGKVVIASLNGEFTLKR